MQTRNSPPHLFSQSTVVVVLVLLICLTVNVTVQAQKKPPILSDKDISAFNKAEIIALEKTAADLAHPSDARLARNKLIAITVEQVDTAFNDFRTKSRKRTDTLSFLFDFLEIGASSAISIVGGSRSKALIGEGLSLFQGSRSAFNKDFRFLERQILFNKMVAKRADKLTAIYEKLNKGVDEYPWEQARSELRDYFFAGTIDEALTSLNVDTGAEAQNSGRALIDAKRAAGIKGAVSDEAFHASESNATLIDAITLPKAKAAFAAIKLEPTLSPLLPTLATRNGVQPSLQALIEGSLVKIDANNATLDDYRLVLLQLNGVVTDLIETDPRPNQRFNTILNANR